MFRLDDQEELRFGLDDQEVFKCLGWMIRKYLNVQAGWSGREWPVSGGVETGKDGGISHFELVGKHFKNINF